MKIWRVLEKFEKIMQQLILFFSFPIPFRKQHRKCYKKRGRNIAINGAYRII